MAWTFYNASGEALTSFGPVALTDLDIDGGTDVGEAIVDADLFIIDNGAGGTNRKTAASRIKTYAGTTQAVKSDIEAETNQDTYIPPDLLVNHEGIAKAWVVIPSDAASITESYNTASVTDSGTGERIWIFDTDFAANTFATVTGNNYDTNDSINFGYRSHAVGQVLLSIRNTATNSLIDNATANAAFGKQ